jgi:hypothetical protein
LLPEEASVNPKAPSVLFVHVAAVDGVVPIAGLSPIFHNEMYRPANVDRLVLVPNATFRVVVSPEIRSSLFAKAISYFVTSVIDPSKPAPKDVGIERTQNKQAVAGIGAKFVISKP